MTDYTPAAQALPPVTAIIGAQNDAETVETAIGSVLAQDYGPGVDVIVSVAPSTDGTADLVERLAAENPRITVIQTPSKSHVVALNEAIAAARTSIIINVDARSELESDYARLAVETMARTDAAALVGRSIPRGQTTFERAVAVGLTHRFGLARDPLYAKRATSATLRPAEHVMRRRALIEAGLFNEEIRHGQMWELNARLLESGRAVLYTPELSYSYRPASHPGALARSLFADGLWRGEFARAFPDERDLRFTLPPGVVLATIGAFILGAAGLFGVVAGAIGVAGVISVILFALLVVPAAYVLSTAVLAVSTGARTTARTGLWFAAVLPLIQFSWGFGYIAGFLNIEGAADTVIVDFD